MSLRGILTKLRSKSGLREHTGNVFTPSICRYSDCPESNTVAREDSERITCATCREDMGLPEIKG